MNTRCLTALLFSVILHFSFGQSADTEQVKKTFDTYKQAILDDNGPLAASQIDSRTLQYYSSILEQVKTADSATVEGMNILDQLMVFSIRHRTSKAEILSFDGKALFVYAVKSGMVGKNSVQNAEIGTITITDNLAKGQMLNKGQTVPIYFHFYKEASTWKLDLTSIFGVSTMAFQNMADGSGQKQSEYLFSLLEIISGKKPEADIWKPVK
jgi:hypothetical protein